MERQPLPQTLITASGIRTEPSLYRRLGGYDTIAAIIDSVLERLGSDTRFARFNGGRGEDSRRSGRQLLVDQLCELSGGPCIFLGRDMRTSHARLGITKGDWKATMRHMARTLRELRVARKESDEVIALWTCYKGEIVALPGVR